MTPEESLALIQHQRADTRRRRGGGPAPILGMWGLAWLIGFGCCYLAARGVMPMPVAVAVTIALSVVAVTVPIVQGVRAARGVRGPSTTVGTMYGVAWGLAFALTSAINGGLERYVVSPDGLSLLWTASSMVVVGLLYLTAGMLWQSWPQYLLGAWVLVFAAVGVLVGVPANFLVLSLAGGGGMLALAVFWALR